MSAHFPHFLSVAALPGIEYVCEVCMDKSRVDR